MHGPIYRSRIRELVRQIVPYLKAGDRVLDVGCGFGSLGRAMLDSPAWPPGASVRGLERVKRGDERIEVDAYDGLSMPYEPRSFDVVILADVLHHDPDPDRVIQQCIEASRRLLIIKDHKLEGPWAKQRVSLIDWAANAPHGVPCLYRYNTRRQWAESHHRHGLRVVHEAHSMRLYPPLVNMLFGRRLQYLAVLRVPHAPG